MWSCAVIFVVDGVYYCYHIIIIIIIIGFNFGFKSL